MARLITPLVVPLVTGALLWVAPTQAESVATWQSHISEASQRFGIPEDWIARVMRAESGGRKQRNGKLIRSRVGAMGLMQIMPGTWAGLTVRYSLGTNPDDPRANILGGTAYLREMYDQFGYPGLFAAYNAGPARYASTLAGRGRLPRETIAYVAAITGSAPPVSLAPPKPEIHAQNGREIAIVSAPPSLFFRMKSPQSSGSASSGSVTPSSLFVALKKTQRGSE